MLDDFGAGGSSFELIRRLPVGRLKIERRFVADLPLRRDNAAIVGAVIGLASALDLSVTAKGVESESQCDYLKRLGCASAQGFFFAAPLDAERARTLVDAAPLSGETLGGVSWSPSRLRSSAAATAPSSPPAHRGGQDAR